MSWMVASPANLNLEARHCAPFHQCHADLVWETVGMVLGPDQAYCEHRADSKVMSSMIHTELWDHEEDFMEVVIFILEKAGVLQVLVNQGIIG